MTEAPKGEAGEAGESGQDAADAHPTLQEEFADLSPELRRSMVGKPAQMITGILIGTLILVALLFGLTSLAKNGSFAPAPPSSSPSPSPQASPGAMVTGGVLAFAITR